MIKKILFIGDMSSYARARQRCFSLQGLGYIVNSISSSELEKYLRPQLRSSLLERLRFRFGYPADTQSINQKIFHELISFQPDLLWVEKTNIIWLKTYKKIKSLFPKLKIIYYSEDDIFLKHNRSAYLTKSLPQFDIVFTTKPRNLEELPKLGAKKCICVYQSYDKHFHRPMYISAEDKRKWGADVGFVGTFEQDRAEKMLFLAKKDIKIRIWGSNWQSWKNKHLNLIVEDKPVFNEDFIKVINSTKINLNFLRKMNRDQHTSRSLEIPACKSFMLAERTDEHKHLFEEGKEAEFFEEKDELIQKVSFYVENEEKRLEIANAGYQRCISNNYSHESRLRKMIEQIDKDDFETN